MSTDSGPIEVKITAETSFPADGNVEVRVDIPRPAAFPLWLRVPAWSTACEAKVGEESWRGKPGEYLKIERTWTCGEAVRISIEMTGQVISGVPSYPGYAAIKRGPQVLAVDSKVNPDVELWLAGFRHTASMSIELREAADRLPKKWIGTQAYLASGAIGNEEFGTEASDLALAPISDAGQSAGEYRVWLREQK